MGRSWAGRDRRSSGPRMHASRFGWSELILSGFGFSRERGKGGRPVALLFQQLDLQLRLLEAGFALLQQFVAFLELGKQVSQRDIARLHRLNHGFESAERVLERQG